MTPNKKTRKKRKNSKLSPSNSAMPTKLAGAKKKLAMKSKPAKGKLVKSKKAAEKKLAMKSKPAKGKLVKSKKAAKKKLAMKGKPARHKLVKSKKAVRKKRSTGRPMAVSTLTADESQMLDSTVLSSARIGVPSGGQSGDLQGLSGVERADSESVEELLEEGNAFEAGVVMGVENADDADLEAVHTREV